MDFPTRARIVIGMMAIVLALLASVALLNLLVLEPGTGEQDDGGGPGTTFQPQPSGTDDPQPTTGDEGNGTAEPTQTSGKKNPCKTGKSFVRAASITTTAMALMLWLLGVWWRQQRQTRVMNGWAIAGLVFTLMAVTLFFAWHIINQICELRVTDLDSCREIARNLMVTFVAFLVPAIGFLGYAYKRKREGHKFMGLWAGAGFVFTYLTIMALGGFIVADDICDRYFRPDLDDIDLDGPDGDGTDTGSGTQTGTQSGTQTGGPPPGNNNPPPTGGPGNEPGRGGNQNSGGGGGPRLVGVPQISPVALLIIMGIAAIIVIVVLAVRGGGKGFRGGAAGLDEALIVEDRGRLLAMLRRTDLASKDKVVAAYRAFLAHCAVRGFQKSDAETPFEHARRAIVGLSLPEPDTLALANAYSQTRLGNSPPPRTLRDKALAFMRSLEARR